MNLLEKISSGKRFNLALAGIVIAGAVFRFRDIGTESLTADEASALLRLHFSSFSAMIEGGVRPDGHPAFAQVLLWFWTKWFGVSEFSIRFPFALMGTACVFLAADSAKKLFNDTVSLCVAGGMAFLQFPLMYSQLARPYAPGLFFVLLSMFFLLRFLGEKKVSRKTIIALSLSFSLSAYSHYFAMMEAGLIALAGSFLVKKNNRKAFFLSCGISIALFLPYVGIFLHQLKIAGVGGAGGWLGKPNGEFLLHHLMFIFNSSRGLTWTVLGFVFLSAIIFRKNKSKMHLLLFTLWLIPLVVGYIYSVTVNPVLMDSVLLFEFPFLLIFLFGWLPPLDWTNNILKEKKLVATIPAAITLGLLYYVGQYKPYRLTDHFGRLKELVNQTIDWQETAGLNQTDVFYNVDAPYFVDYYYERAGKKKLNVLGTINNGNSELKSFRKLVENSNAEFFIYAWSTKYSPPEVPEIIREKFPYLLKRDYFFNSAFYVFGRSATLSYLHESDDVLWKSDAIFFPNGDSSQWSKPCNLLLGDTLLANTWNGKFIRILQPIQEYVTSPELYSTMLDSSCIYGPLLKMKLGDMLRSPDNILELDADVKLKEKNANAVLVIEIHRGDSLLSWNGRETNTQLSAADTGDYHHVYFGIQLPEGLLLNDEVRFYIYSQNKKPILVRSLTAKAMRGHEGIYGVRSDFQ
ncbi:MAG: glycosyltransferase family 39 protein [Bacteroidetes bacterium]|nr:glycosyltransferase family 39 protein [Bacteroidota bacterium]